MRVFCCSVLLLVAVCGAQAQLTTKTTAYGSKPGYIEKATLVVQPHGAYVEQALYLNYGDRGAFGSNPNVEIVHRFRLPAKAVVNDLWLWMGDSVMQAIMLDVWKARSIYDSITSSLHDPAFLSKKGDMYELHIFPLRSGWVRRVRLNFLVPARWVGTAGSAELPLRMLQDNNASVKPLEVMFRTVDRSWGTPTITEAPGLVFDTLPDTRGYKFLVTNIPDITPLKSLTMTFSADLDEGTRLTSASRKKTEQSWFEYGFDPGVVFKPPTDTTVHKRLFALDISSVYDRYFPIFLPKLRQFLRAACTPRDSLALLVGGAGRVARVGEGWIPARTSAIDSLVSLFSASAQALEINSATLPRVEFCDDFAETCWSFPGIETIAQTHTSRSLLEGLRRDTLPDVLATYKHNSESWAETQPRKDSIIIAMQSLFLHGSRVLSYIDEGHNQEIEKTFIPGVSFVRERPDKVVQLYRAPNGNLGANFPEIVDHLQRGYLVVQAGNGVTTEVIDAQGRPVVVSRHVDNGLMVLTCLWSFRADGALRGTVGAPLLGLTSTLNGRISMLQPLMREAQRVHAAETCTDFVLMSNGDSVYMAQPARDIAAAYASGFSQPVPRVITLNLLAATGYTPPFVTEGGVRYYGSGMLLRSIADALGGQYLAASDYSWPRLCEIVVPGSFAAIDSIRLDVVVLGRGGDVQVLREIDPVPGDLRKVRFFFGETGEADSLRFTATARLASAPQPRVHVRTVHLTKDSAQMNWTIPPMLANEQLRDMFAKKPPLDTAGIVSLARKNRLLCDFTAFLALEPNDTLKFMRDPFDETKLTDVPPVDFTFGDDSLDVIIAPNPFRGTTQIAVHAPEGSDVSVTLFDMLGRLVRTLASTPQTSRTQVYTWNGTDALNTRLPAGIYFVHVLARGASNAAPLSVIRRLVRVE